MNRRTATGDTRRTAMTVPMRSEPIAESTDSWIVTQKAPRTSYSLRISPTRHLSSGRAVPRHAVGPYGRTAYRGRDVRVPSGAGVRRRGVAGAGLVVRRPEVLVDDLLPLAVGDHLLDRVGDLLALGRVALLEADAVPLLRERLTDDLELALVLLLGRVPGEDRVVGGQGVDGARGERDDALGVGAELLEVDPGHRLLDLLGGGGAGHRAQLLAVEGVGSG